MAASTGRFTPGQVTDAGWNRLSATGPKNKANPRLELLKLDVFRWIDRQALVADLALDKGVKNN